MKTDSKVNAIFLLYKNNFSIIYASPALLFRVTLEATIKPLLAGDLSPAFVSQKVQLATARKNIVQIYGNKFILLP
ncbi:MAG: hypothetical protein LBT94_02000 [Prevotellaceae bacterium]|jgi:hypothetical protein|nr:hypothetical protein [Prevotellaceae bacterium]